MNEGAYGERSLLRVTFAALEFADALFEKSDTFVQRGNGFELNVNGTCPIVEGSKHFGLHVAHALREISHIGFDLGSEEAEVSLSGRFVVVVWHVRHIDE
jgi:hypothetical protein